MHVCFASVFINMCFCFVSSMIRHTIFKQQSIQLAKILFENSLLSSIRIHKANSTQLNLCKALCVVVVKRMIFILFFSLKFPFTIAVSMLTLVTDGTALLKSIIAFPFTKSTQNNNNIGHPLEHIEK